MSLAGRPAGLAACPRCERLVPAERAMMELFDDPQAFQQRGLTVEMLGNPTGKKVAVFCGKGNNGGDGYVIARHLHNRGARVDLVTACRVREIDPESDAGTPLGILHRMRFHPIVADGQEGQLLAKGLAKRADRIVDALFGTGLTGEVRDPYCALIRLINAEDKPVLAVDIPIGIDANTGNVLRAAVRAAHTATFVIPKHGFRLNEGASHVGQVTVVDIGVPIKLVQEVLLT